MLCLNLPDIDHMLYPTVPSMMLGAEEGVQQICIKYLNAPYKRGSHLSLSSV